MSLRDRDFRLDLGMRGKGEKKQYDTHHH
jgi:hypothetical protein